MYLVIKYIIVIYMNKLRKRPLFYFFAVPISFLAGYGYANTIWLLQKKISLSPYKNDYDI